MSFPKKEFSGVKSGMLFCRSDQEVRAARRQRTGRKLGKAVVRSVFWLRGPSKGKEAASRSGSKAQENVLEIIVLPYLYSIITPYIPPIL